MAKKSGCRNFFFVFFLLAIFVIIAVGFYAYNYVFSDNVKSETLETELFIPSTADFSEVLDSLKAKDLLINLASFRQVAKARKYDQSVKSGRYLIKNDWNNLQIVNYLRSGRQEPVNFILNNARTREDLAGKVGRTLEVDSIALLHALHSSETAHKYGFTKESFPAMFLANTYEFYWDTDLEGFLNRMKKEYERYWTDERIQQAKNLNLSPVEVIILASIVEEETKATEELPIVAGLYLNRLEKGMKLEADPTVKYAVGDFTLRRILNKHLETDSPYNTYMYEGLLPGPIRIPELNVIEAVLSPASHNYLFMCAKADFSGKHAFATTHRQHIINANEYRRALNARGIYK